MLSRTKAMIRTCIEQLQAGYRHTYGNLKAEYSDLISWVAQIALDNIATSNAPYHNVEHTILVTLAGQEILRGKQQTEGGISCEDWLHFIVSLLCHDIGYVQGVCPQDQVNEGLCAKGVDGEIISLPTGTTDASLTPYHVDRGKLFIEEYFVDHPLIDVTVIQRNIEMTRFPIPADEAHQDTTSYAGLVRAADLIGQLSDPKYLQKIPALFREFQETGTNQNLGYHHPQDLRLAFPNFFWKVIYRYIQEGLRFLEETPMGRQLITNLYANVSEVEQELLVKNPPKSAEAKFEPPSSSSFANGREFFEHVARYERNQVRNPLAWTAKFSKLESSAEEALERYWKFINLTEGLAQSRLISR